MTEHIPARNGPDQPQQAADTTPENPWPLSRLSDNLKHYIERVSPTWIEGQLIAHRVS
ncbi:MAG: exodeoxyribonuclease VII large subunit, partial [Yaniella sp.]|nr:exodeoxyribonuclease VII large subunit [Yaniella sp.]